MFIVTYRNFFYVLSGLIVVAAIVVTVVLGLRFSIDFTGGALTEVRYPGGNPALEELSNRLNNLPLGNYSLRPAGEDRYILRTRDLSEEERQALEGVLSLGGERNVVIERFNSVGPVLGTELRNKALVAIAIVIVLISLYIAFVFRKVSEPVSSFKYGLVAILALIHDTMVPVGIFAVLGVLAGVEVDALFVSALLAILGYSINDTIIVFDRVRENLRLNQELRRKEDFALTVGKSLQQAYARSINTSLTTALVLVALFFLGGDATKFFALALFLGVVAGAYSSIFLAAPLLVTLERRQGSKR